MKKVKTVLLFGGVALGVVFVGRALMPAVAPTAAPVTLGDKVGSAVGALVDLGKQLWGKKVPAVKNSPEAVAQDNPGDEPTVGQNAETRPSGLGGQILAGEVFGAYMPVPRPMRPL